MAHSTLNLSDDTKYARMAQLDKELSENLQKLTLPMEELRPHAQQLARDILSMVALSAPVTHTQNEMEQRDAITDHLLDAVAIPLMPSVADFFLNAGLSSEHLTYGLGLGGLEVAHIDGIHLMKLAGFLDFDAPTLMEAALLMSLGENDTKH